GAVAELAEAIVTPAPGLAVGQTGAGTGLADADLGHARERTGPGDRPDPHRPRRVGVAAAGTEDAVAVEPPAPRLATAQDRTGGRLPRRDLAHVVQPLRAGHPAHRHGEDARLAASVTQLA